MDILSPDLVWIGNICYRVNSLKDGISTKSEEHQVAYIEDPEDLAPLSCTMPTDEPPAMEFDVEVTDNGRFRLSLPIPKVFWAKLVGAKGMAKRRVEEETRTTVTIPRPTQDNDVVVVGDDRRDVLLARSHIYASIRAARSYLSYTHFISLPVQSSEIQKNYSIWKSKVLERCPSLSEELFTPVERFHLTLTMLCLTDNRERQHAIQMFTQVQDTVRHLIKGRALKIQLKGLEIMNDDDSKVNILYVKVEDELVQEVADVVAAHFADSGYVKERDVRERVKLHLTLMNTRYLNKSEDDPQEGRERGPPRRGRKPSCDFDARIILRELKQFNFGYTILTKMEMSQLGNHGPDGYYLSSASMQL